MPREIKFRAWSTTGKIMCEWEKYFLHNTLVDCKDLQETNTWKVMQYTSIKDKNGKEIYEGDILCVQFEGNYPHHTEIMKVEFTAENKLGMFIVVDEDGDKWQGLSDTSCEIIGNIYENPELLEVEK